jgi:hypothetical protein
MLMARGCICAISPFAQNCVSASVTKRRCNAVEH